MKKHTKNRARQIAAIAAKKDTDIDLSEMPEVVELERRGNWEVLPSPKEASDHAVGHGHY